MDLNGSAHGAACVTERPRSQVRPAGANPRYGYEVPALLLRSPLTGIPPTVRLETWAFHQILGDTPGLSSVLLLFYSLP